MIHDSNWKDCTWKTPEGKRLIKSFHISDNCYAIPRWVLISTTGEGGRVTRNWQAKSVYMLELKKPSDLACSTYSLHQRKVLGVGLCHYY